jgi:hypothetical protein
MGKWKGQLHEGANDASPLLLNRLHRYKKLRGRFVLAAIAENV